MNTNISALAREWLQSQYLEETALVGAVTNPEREQDYIAGFIGALALLSAKRIRAKQLDPEINKEFLAGMDALLEGFL